MYLLRAFALLFLTQAVLAQQPTPILPDAKLTPGDTFDVTAEDVCLLGYAKKVRAVPAWLKRQAYVEYGITQYKTRGKYPSKATRKSMSRPPPRTAEGLPRFDRRGT